MAVDAGKPSNHSLKRIYNLSGRELVKVSRYCLGIAFQFNCARVILIFSVLAVVSPPQVQPVATRVPVARSDSADCSGSHPALVESAPVPVSVRSNPMQSPPLLPTDLDVNIDLDALLTPGLYRLTLRVEFI
jgi:hypothetical protein